MAYNSTRTGPEIDAAVQLLGEIQTIRNESNGNLATVQTLAGQVQANATSAATSATTATTKAADATTKAAAASGSAAAAAASESAATSSKTTAQTASSSAQGSATAAAASAQAAAQSRTAAGLSELVAAGYAGQTATLNAQQTALTRSLAALGDKGQSLHLDFALKAFAKGDRNGLTGSAAFSDIITFTRASTGTYFDINGVLRVAASNEPRFDYDPITRAAKGLLIEEQRTNLLKYSEQFDHALWTKKDLTVSANAIVAPDGNLTADKLVEAAINGGHYIDQIYNGVFVLGDKYCVSYFVRAAERTAIRLRTYYAAGNTGGTYVDYNLATRAMSASALVISNGISDVGDGWLRCWFVVAVDTPAEARLLCRVSLISAMGITEYAGDGLSGLYVWGGELKPGANQDSYIPTAASQVTRATDTVNINDLSGWFYAAEGTLCAEATNIGGAGSTIVQLGADDADRILISTALPGVAGSGGNTVVGAVAQASMQTALGANGQKVAYAYAVDNFACAVNGALIGTKLSGAIPVVSILRLGRSAAITGSRYIKNVRYFPRRLSNSELQALSA